MFGCHVVMVISVTPTTGLLHSDRYLSVRRQSSLARLAAAAGLVCRMAGHLSPTKHQVSFTGQCQPGCWASFGRKKRLISRQSARRPELRAGAVTPNVGNVYESR